MLNRWRDRLYRSSWRYGREEREGVSNGISIDWRRRLGRSRRMLPIGCTIRVSGEWRGKPAEDLMIHLVHFWVDKEWTLVFEQLTERKCDRGYKYTCVVISEVRFLIWKRCFFHRNKYNWRDVFYPLRWEEGRGEGIRSVSFQRNTLPPICTHNMVDPDNDQVLIGKGMGTVTQSIEGVGCAPSRPIIQRPSR